jgi:threonine/homoserine/homoserine lactone efflux protein
MMLLLTDPWPFATYCVLMSGTPGPNNVMLAASGANFGYRRTLPHLLGIAAGSAALTLLACLGLGAVFRRWPGLQHALQWAGALYLLSLAWRVSRSAIGTTEGGRPLSFGQAASFQLVNPKSWTRALTIGAMFMPAGAEPVPVALALSAAGAAIGLPCISMWALFGVGIRRFLAVPRRRQWFNAIMALALAVLALAFLR